MAYALGQSFVSNTSALSTATCVFGGAIASGDLLVVPFTVVSDTETITSVTDSLGNTYSVAISGPAGSGTLERPYIAWCVSGFSGTPTVTVVKSGTASITIEAGSFTGAPASPTVITASGTSAGTPAANPSATLSGVTAGSLVFGASVQTSAPTVGAGYTTAISRASNYYELSEYNLSSGAGSVVVATVAASCNYCIAAIAFSPAATTVYDPITACFPIGYYE